MSKRGKILVVDDEQVILDAVKKICENEEFSVDQSIDAMDALVKLHKQNYDLILCDIMMPDIDGFKFLEEIAKRKIDTFVIMMTGYSTVENAVHSLYKGAIDFIPKPFTSDELVYSVLRGMKYIQIDKELKKQRATGQDFPMIYVPCPAKYSRLGYSAWVMIENDGSAIIGVTDLFLKTIDSVKKIKFLNPGEEITQGVNCITIISVDDSTHTILSPVSGKILENNQKLLADNTILEKDPYFNGWLYRLIPSDVEYELKSLVPCSSDRI